MCMARFKRSLLKALFFVLAFIPIHFLYDWWPSPVTALLSENGGESIFQHMKIGLWAWVAASLVEFFLWFRRGPRRAAFAESRTFGALLIPYLQTVVWYLAPAIVGRIESTAAEVAWSFAACFAAGVGTSVIEWDMENAPGTLARRAVLAAFSVACLFLLIRFSFGGAPWVDVFAAPAD
jgi:hypothetical protein